MKRDKEAVEAGIQGYEARCGDISNYYDQWRIKRRL